jgi:hypothetical protein
MSKSKNVPAVTEAARDASKTLSVWSAVETRAKQLKDAAEKQEANGSFAEIHFTGARVQGVIKAGDVVLKIDA